LRRHLRSRPDSLQAATFTWGNPYYTKVTLATIGSAPPDVAVSHLTREKNLARAGLLTEITDDMLSLVGLKPTDFNPTAWETQKVDGKSYAIPLDTHPFVLYYNRDVCDKAGLLNSDGSLKEIKGTEGETFSVKGLNGDKPYTIGKDSIVVLGPAFRFDKTNVDNFNF